MGINNWNYKIPSVSRYLYGVLSIILFILVIFLLMYGVDAIIIVLQKAFIGIYNSFSGGVQ